jgi:competence protein ComEC
LPVTDVLGAWPASLAHIKNVPHQTCVAGQEWQVEGWSFVVISPSQRNAEGNIDNNRSCALRVSKGEAAILLPGDMEGPGEYALLDTSVAVRSNVLVLGHHGARAASTEEWLRQVAPELAIASAGYFNRYGHPSIAVRERLVQAGIPMLNTANTGAIVIDMRATGEMHWQAYRQLSGRYWW